MWSDCLRRCASGARGLAKARARAVLSTLCPEDSHRRCCCPADPDWCCQPVIWPFQPQHIPLPLCSYAGLPCEAPSSVRSGLALTPPPPDWQGEYEEFLSGNWEVVLYPHPPLRPASCTDAARKALDRRAVHGPRREDRCKSKSSPATISSLLSVHFTLAVCTPFHRPSKKSSCTRKGWTGLRDEHQGHSHYPRPVGL